MLGRSPRSPHAPLSPVPAAAREPWELRPGCSHSGSLAAFPGEFPPKVSECGHPKALLCWEPTEAAGPGEFRWTARDPSGRCACRTGPRGGASRVPRLASFPPAPKSAARGPGQGDGGHERGSGGNHEGARPRELRGDRRVPWERRRPAGGTGTKSAPPGKVRTSRRARAAGGAASSFAAPERRGLGRGAQCGRAVFRLVCWAHNSCAPSRMPRFLPEGPCALLTPSLPTQKLTGATRTKRRGFKT